MGRRGSVYIVPDENKILTDEFFVEVQKDHIEAFIKFDEKFKIGYNFQAEDTLIAPYQVASDGHLVIKFEEDSKTAICYIPKVVTDRQNNWIHAHSDKLMKCKLIGGFGLKDRVSPQEAIKINGLDNIIRICDKRNMFYEKKEDDNYVRKEI